MSIPQIYTKAEYQAALSEVSELFANEPKIGTEDGIRFEALLSLVEAYEAKHYPVDRPSPTDARAFRLDQERPIP
ncbi:hypothetical protein GCM10010468_82360 [Actinocorallia longicatena]|uniref:HTH-type transcriptional regulator/antitoxin HigA n=2 Tax=Actinocorallia longicatena TaxID=111803 RepID=A0ABP6QSM1_9ACTN